MKLGLKFGAIVGLDDVDPEGEAPDHFIEKPDGRALVAGIVDLEDANACAIVDRRELVQSLRCARDALEELHVHLQAMPGLGFS